MNVVDSSGWLEYLADGPNADFFALAIESVSELVVPTTSVYEVFKRVYQQRGEDDALRSVAVMMQGIIVDLDTVLALNAAKISIDTKLPIDPEAAQIYSGASSEDKKKLRLLLGLWLREFGIPSKPLKELMDEISDKAQARGLTSEILELCALRLKPGVNRLT